MTVKPTHKKKPNPDLRAAGSGKCPVPGSRGCSALGDCKARLGRGGSGAGDAASHLAGLCPLLTAGPDCGRTFPAMASKCPLRAGDRLRCCVANKWRQHRCGCSQRRVGRSLYHHEAGSRATSYACAEVHTQAGKADVSRGANLPHPPSPIYSQLKRKTSLGGSLWSLRST